MSDRELDRRVAEVVMGLPIVPADDPYPNTYHVPGGGVGLFGDYSSDPAAAHRVIARMAELGWWCEAFYEGTSPDWRVIFGNEKNIMLDSVGPFPLAVCKAALAAMEAK